MICYDFYIHLSLNNNRAHVLESFHIPVFIFHMDVVKHTIENNILSIVLTTDERGKYKIKLNIHNFFIQHRIELLFTTETRNWNLFVEKPYNMGVRRVVPINTFSQNHKSIYDGVCKEMFLGVLNETSFHDNNNSNDLGYESASESDICGSSYSHILLQII